MESIQHQFHRSSCRLPVVSAGRRLKLSRNETFTYPNDETVMMENGFREYGYLVVAVGIIVQNQV